MNKIYIRNAQDTVELTPALRGVMRRAVNATLKSEGYEGVAEVSVTVTDNAGINGLNREHRGIDRPTDVLSFPLFEERTEGAATPLGDIVLSLERAAQQAEEFGHSLLREVAFLCVHSVLHLLGYDHETGAAEERDMFARQEAVVQKMGLGRE